MVEFLNRQSLPPVVTTTMSASGRTMMFCPSMPLNRKDPGRLPIHTWKP